MDKLEKFWRDAPAGCKVCAETGVTKNMVLNAIIKGANDLETLKAEVPLCDGDRCTTKNSSKAGCTENAKVILSIYAPIYALMKEGHTHDHDEDPECGSKVTGNCGNCKLCK